VQTGVGPVGLQVSRDRAGSFESVLVPKRSGRISGGLEARRAPATVIGCAGAALASETSSWIPRSARKSAEG
jgi:hypothetical protein